MRLLGFLPVMLLTWLFTQPVLAGRLQDVEDTATSHGGGGDDDANDTSSSSSSGGENYNTSSSTSDDSPVGRMVLHVLLAPWTLPHAALDQPCYAGFAAYPYADGPGLLRPRAGPKCLPGASDSPLSEADAAVDTSHSLAANADLEGGYVLGNIVAGSIGARLQLPMRLELEGRITMWRDLEAHPPEQALGGTLLGGFRFAQAKYVTFRTGVGMRVFSLHETLFGVDFLYGLDVYGQHPIVFHLDLHGGTLGKALAGQARATLGVQLSKFELYAGYDHTAFAGNGRVTRLGGPVLGLRAWF